MTQHKHAETLRAIADGAKWPDEFEFNYGCGGAWLCAVNFHEFLLHYTGEFRRKPTVLVKFSDERPCIPCYTDQGHCGDAQPVATKTDAERYRKIKAEAIRDYVEFKDVWYECGEALDEAVDALPLEQHSSRNKELKMTNKETMQRKWVGLTAEEVEKIVDDNTQDDQGYDIWCNGRDVARLVEALLKERNT